MLIDFHTHTTASDGALSPWDLVTLAQARGVGLLSITDHDTVAGYLAGRNHDAVQEGAVSLVPGIEFSCQWSGVTIHVLGLGIDCDDPAMQRGLATLATAREERGQKIGQRLVARGFDGALEGALSEAGDSQLGRPHFARWLVNEGHVKDHSAAFDRYLGQGKIGDVKAFWPQLQDVVSWIQGSGGVALIAHPYKYKFTGMKLKRLLIDFVAAGGRGIEIHSGRQTPQQTTQLQRYATEFDLEVSAGSDFHRDGPYTAPLGVEVPRCEGLRGVWERWMP